MTGGVTITEWWSTCGDKQSEAYTQQEPRKIKYDGDEAGSTAIGLY